MAGLLMQKTNDKFFILILLLLLLTGIYLLSPILTPFLIGAFLAYLTNPLVTKLISLHIPRLLSVIIVFVFIFAVITLFIVLLIPLIGKQIDAFIEVIPTISLWIQDTMIPWLQYMGVNTDIFSYAGIKTLVIENWAKAGGSADWVLKTMLRSGARVMEWLMNLILVPVVTFYLLCDWNKFLRGLRSLLPRRIEPTVVKLTKECDAVLSAFFRGQLMVMIALGAIYSIGLTLMGLKIGFLIGLLAGILNIVPYLGFLTGIIVASIAAFIQFGSFTPMLFVWLLFIIGNIFEQAYLTPKLVGESVGLHPVAVIFAILAGGNLFGFVGVLLAIPASALIMVWVRYLHHQYHESKLYKA